MDLSSCHSDSNNNSFLTLQPLPFSNSWVVVAAAMLMMVTAVDAAAKPAWPNVLLTIDLILPKRI